MDINVIFVTAGSLVLLAFILKFKNHRLISRTPESWKRIYDVNECPYGARNSNVELDTPLLEERKLIRAIISRKATVEKLKPTSRREHLKVTSKSNKNRKIPRLIIQTNEDDDIPEGMFVATGTVLSKNPNYDYMYFNNVRAREYIEEHYPQNVLDAYDVLIPGAYKADLFRYCVLYITGGVYIDMGMIMLCPLDEIIDSEDTFISPEDNDMGGIYNAFICCEPGCPIIGEAIRLAIANIEARNYTHNPLGITGPLLLAKAFTSITGDVVKADKNYENGIKILKHFKPDDCVSGEILSGGKRIISTRSPTYRRDQKWYNKKPRYTDLWNRGEVYLTSDPRPSVW